MNRSLAPLLVLCCATAWAQPQAGGGAPAVRAWLPTPDPELTRDVMEALGYDVGGGLSSTAVELFLSRSDLAALQSAGFPPIVVETAQPLSQKFPTQEGGGPPSLPSGYHDLAAIAGILTAAQTAYPNLAMVVDLAAIYGPGATFEGRPILALKISDNVQQDEDEPNVLFVSAHHAREIVNPELCLELISTFLLGHGTDPQITALVDSHEIWIAPTWNPDGVNHVWTVNNMWRKNRKPSGNEFGVDQNRNYHLGWNASCGGSSNPASNTYRGPSPASEEETQTMVAFARDRRFAKVMDFHSSGQEVLLTYRCSPMPSVIETFIDAEATALAGMASYGTRQPSAEGEHQEWQTMEITSYAFLVETHTSFQPNYATVTAEAAALWPLQLAALQRAIPMLGHVTDAATGQPLQADLTVAEVSWQNGETRSSEFRFGRYHLWLPPGPFTVTFSATGYFPETITVNVPAIGTWLQDVALQPAPPPFTLVLSTTGGGTGDLHLGFQSLPSGTVEGYLVLSFLTSLPQGQGPLAGIWPDPTTLALLTTPAAPGHPVHWTWPVTAPLFPAMDLILPAGGVPFSAGTELDGVGVALGSGFVLLELTEVIRVVF